MNTTVQRKPDEHQLLGLVVDNEGRRNGSTSFTLAVYYTSGGAELTRVQLGTVPGFATPKIGTRYKIHITPEVPNA